MCVCGGAAWPLRPAASSRHHTHRMGWRAGSLGRSPDSHFGLWSCQNFPLASCPEGLGQEECSCAGINFLLVFCALSLALGSSEARGPCWDPFPVGLCSAQPLPTSGQQWGRLWLLLVFSPLQVGSSPDPGPPPPPPLISLGAGVGLLCPSQLYQNYSN